MPIKHGARLSKCSRNFARVSFRPMISPVSISTQWGPRHPAQPQRADEGGGLPVSVRDRCPATVSARSPAAASRHLGGCPWPPWGRWRRTGKRWRIAGRQVGVAGSLSSPKSARGRSSVPIWPRLGTRSRPAWSWAERLCGPPACGESFFDRLDDPRVLSGVLRTPADVREGQCQLRLKISHFCGSKISHFERAVGPPDAVFGGTDLVEL